MNTDNVKKRFKFSKIEHKKKVNIYLQVDRACRQIQQIQKIQKIRKVEKVEKVEKMSKSASIHMQIDCKNHKQGV